MEHSIIKFFLNSNETHDTVRYSKEYERIFDKRLKLHNEIRETLTEEQRQQFDKFVDLEIDEIALSNEAYFKMGMKAGVRLVSECMFDL